jgi:hypothetical protein
MEGIQLGTVGARYLHGFCASVLRRVLRHTDRYLAHVWVVLLTPRIKDTRHAWVCMAHWRGVIPKRVQPVALQVGQQGPCSLTLRCSICGVQGCCFDALHVVSMPYTLMLWW